MVRVLGVASLLLFSHIALVSARRTSRITTLSQATCDTTNDMSESYDIQLNQLSYSPMHSSVHRQIVLP